MADVVNPENKTLILNHEAILTKLERMACEIAEKHTEQNELVFCGMNTRGFYIADTISQKVTSILTHLKITLVQVITQEDGTTVFSPEVDFQGKSVIVVDDVINTGRTLMWVLNTIFNGNPASIETAFLAKREHRNYPVKADYVGISLATTLQEHVYFDNRQPQGLQVYLC